MCSDLAIANVTVATRQGVYYTCRFYIGRQPCLMVTDVEMLKEILVKQFDCFMDRPVSLLDERMSLHDRQLR